MYKLILIICFFSSVNAFEDNFNEKRHMVFTYACNVHHEQYLGGSVFSVDPKYMGYYFNVRKGVDMKYKEKFSSAFNVGRTKKLNEFSAVYFGAGYILKQDFNYKKRNFQAIGGVIINLNNFMYIEAGYESFEHTISFGIGMSSLISKGVEK